MSKLEVVCFFSLLYPHAVPSAQHWKNKALNICCTSPPLPPPPPPPKRWLGWPRPQLCNNNRAATIPPCLLSPPPLEPLPLPSGAPSFLSAVTPPRRRHTMSSNRGRLSLRVALQIYGVFPKDQPTDFSDGRLWDTKNTEENQKSLFVKWSEKMLSHILSAIRAWTFFKEVWQQITRKSLFFGAMFDVQLNSWPLRRT